MHGNDGPGPGSNGLLDKTYIRIKGIAVHIHHHRSEAQQRYHLGRGHIGKCGDYDLVARFQSEGHESYLEGIRAVAAGNDMSCPRVLRQGRGETADCRTVDERRTVNDLRYGSVDLRLDPHILTVKVYHLNLLQHRTLHHFTSRKEAEPGAVSQVDGNRP